MAYGTLADKLMQKRNESFNVMSVQFHFKCKVRKLFLPLQYSKAIFLRKKRNFRIIRKHSINILNYVKYNL